MSSHVSPKDQSDFLSVIGETNGDFEDNYTAVRPPQYNVSNLPSGVSFPSSPSVPSGTPDNIVTAGQATGRPMSSQLEDAGQHYPASNSTATVTADEVAAATLATQAIQAPGTGPTPRMHIFFHINRDYSGAVQPLTEHAVAALDHDFAHGSVNGYFAEWIRDRSQFPPAGRNISIPQKYRTETATRTGSDSSWSIISRSTIGSMQMEPWADAVCATGMQFAEVSAPNRRGLLDENCM
ncbi:hypothetical protein GGR55DRAFT_71260 [Xylaria sp. FL0064]|nr:hypothetical protein GGR55DRAFT_71260 [Xylaria sp. FL0064]